MRLLGIATFMFMLAAATSFAKGSVTIAAQPTVVTYGGGSTLSGKVSAKGQLTVHAQECGSATFKALKSPVTGAGDWRMTVAPGSRTSYEAKAGGATSSIVTVQVRPGVTLRKTGSHLFQTRVAAAQSFAGKIALFQRRRPTGWNTVRSVVLQQLAGGSPTIVSGSTFRSGIRKGKRVRILLTQRQVGSCYLRATSKTSVS
jgi:hypothetical protein